MARRVDYYRYLASREWRLKRQQVIERAGDVCERCRKASIQNVHHLTYERVGDEHLEDLQGLCRPCHEYVSGERHDDPAATPTGKVYLAGKIGHMDWRHAIFPRLRDFDFPHEFAAGTSGRLLDYSGRWEYTGPFFVGCDHGCYHYPTSHGAVSVPLNREAGAGHYEYSGCMGHVVSAMDVIEKALQGVREADAVFAWIDSLDAYGTLVEIGYSHAFQKPLFVGFDEAKVPIEAIREMWFGHNLAHGWAFHSASAQEAWEEFLYQASEMKFKHPGEM